VHEHELAQREATLQNEQEQLRQQRAILDETATTVEQQRLQAKDMLKVRPRSSAIANCVHTLSGWISNLMHRPGAADEADSVA